jgi:type VI secretion system secreted protein VgrG
MTADPSVTAFGSTHEDLRFALSIDGKREDVVVERVEGEEALSEIFVYELTVVSPLERGETFAEDLAKDVSIEIVRDQTVERRVRGILTEVRPDGATLANERCRTTLVVLPRLAELQRVKRSRTYKRSDDESGGYTVKDIVTLLLDDWNIESEWRIDRSLDKYVLRTQFDETNYEFMRRLLAFEGIHFFFEHGPERTKVIFTNLPGRLDIERPRLPFREVGRAVTGDHVRRIRAEQRIPTDRVILTDFNYEKPLLDMTALATGRAQDGKRVVHEHPGRYGLPEAVGKRLARQRLQELNSTTQRFFGETNCPRLSPGFRFEVANHKNDAFNGKFVATQVKFSASIGGGRTDGEDALSTAFEAVRAGTPLPPASRRWPTPPLQTALVVGPIQDHPHVREPGVVKVRFYWDDVSSDQMSEEARCAWVRVATDLAGPGYGSVMWPRVGMEVIVDYLNGKLDEPVVIRTLYHSGVNAPPFDLSEDATRYGFKSSSVGGDGSNEHTFDDRAGKELVFLQAQRDRKTVVKRNEEKTVGGEKKQEVKGDADDTYRANHDVTVLGNRKVSVTQNVKYDVVGNRDELVMGQFNTNVMSGELHKVTHWYNLEPGHFKIKTGTYHTFSGDTLQEFGPTKTVIKGDWEQHIHGRVTTTQLGASKWIKMDNHHTITVGAQLDMFIGAKLAMTLGGQAAINLTRVNAAINAGLLNLTLNAGAGITYTKGAYVSKGSTTVDLNDVIVRKQTMYLERNGMWIADADVLIVK